MGLEELVRFFRRSGRLVAATTLVAALAAGAVAVTVPKRVEASLAFAINRINREATVDYQFDGYYALQAADLYAQTVVSWFSTPAVVRDIYAAAGLTPDLESQSAFASKFRTKRYSAQNIVVRFTEPDADRARQLATAVTDTLRKRTATLNETADRKSIFEIVASEPVVTERRPAVGTAVAVAALGGFLLGVFGGAIRTASARLRDADRA
jgi:hypothetical protein